MNELKHEEIKEPYRLLDGTHQFRINFFHWQLIISLVNWRKANADWNNYRRELWEKEQDKYL